MDNSADPQVAQWKGHMFITFTYTVVSVYSELHRWLMQQKEKPAYFMTITFTWIVKHI